MSTTILIIATIALAAFGLATIYAINKEYRDPGEISILCVIDVLLVGMVVVAWLGGGK